MKKLFIIWISAVMIISVSYGNPNQSKQIPADMKPIQLLKPEITTGKPLMKAFSERKSSRLFTPKKLPLQELSNLLWAAFGINRQGDKNRTAPSAMNWQEIDVYVVLQEGIYLYDAVTNALNPILKGDYREKTTRIIQPSRKSIANAPVQLVYVANFSRIGIMGAFSDKMQNSGISAGCIVQNVYLYCASTGLGTVVRALVDKEELSKTMGLTENEKILIAQTVGYTEK
jgi:SagB-type dehydrogenase family enzyme